MNPHLNGLPAHKEELGMARHGKVLPARRPREDDDSILLRSAETIGRVIGSLQRQLDGTRGRLSKFVGGEELGHDGNGSGRGSKIVRKSAAAKTRKAPSPASKASRPPKAKRSAKTVAARKK
jgi:hypothetical protein